MELKVWVDGVQRVVCGVTEATTCQEVVIALAQAIGRTGRYTLIEKSSAKQREVLVRSAHNSPSMSPRLTGNRVEDLTQLVRLQRETLSVLDSRMGAYEAELRMLTEKRVGPKDDELYVKMTEEISRLEKQVRRNKVEIEEEEFWATELQIERESERQLQERIQELSSRLRSCEADMDQRLMSLRGVEAGIEAQRQHKEIRETQQASEGEVKARLQRVKAELKAQAQHTAQLENSSRAVDRSLAESCKRMQESQYELEQLTKELRQVNLQQFIQQTGTKVTVLPVEPGDEDLSNTTDDKDFAALTGSLKRPGLTYPVVGSIRGLHSSISSGLNPEGIYV
ncbi:ras association domain-containing protein 8 [Pseudorasbora parva]|uniref:ras association domain-containing protein 8 n=1 Tax=Pseudorasbora parva TaxID=51549 RepID=UPI00351E865B